MRNLPIAALMDSLCVFHLAQAVVLLLTTPLADEELPSEEPLLHVGQLYVLPALLGNADDRDEVLPAQVGQYADDALDAERADVADFAPLVPQVAQEKESVLPVYPLEKVCAVPDRAMELPAQPGHAAEDDRAADAEPNAPIDDNDIVVSPLHCYQRYSVAGSIE